MLDVGTADAEYLEQTRTALQRAFSEFEPDVILYNAGERGESPPIHYAADCVAKTPPVTAGDL